MVTNFGNLINGSESDETGRDIYIKEPHLITAAAGWICKLNSD